MSKPLLTQDFLSANGLPLTKSYELDAEGRLLKTPYPNVSSFTSVRETYSNMSQFAALLSKHAALGNCMLKGELQRQLTHESRRGSTDRNSSTRLLVLDCDSAPFNTPAAFMKAIGMHDLSYVVQYSASHGLPGSVGLNAHIFVLLSDYVIANFLKSYLMELNLKTQALKDAITLSKTGAALHWPLDITACQNDKLIYIAPPHLGPGLKPMAKSIVYVKGKKEALSTSELQSDSLDQLREQSYALRNQLRVAAGLKSIKSAPTFVGEYEVQPKPGEAVITGMRKDRGFVYFNLNGGDSWGYYHAEDNYELIHNFKGEPAYKTKELLPGYYADCVAAAQAAMVQPTAAGDVILAFRDFKTAVYWNGTWNEKDQKLTLAVARNETQLEHFMIQHGKQLAGPIPVWDMHFNPGSATVVDLDNRTLNTYVPSEYMRAKKYKKRATLPPVAEKIISHVVGGGDIREHWDNWLACIFQRKVQKTQTAWIFTGTSGTGKGLLVNKILWPLIGVNHLAYKRARELLETTNGWAEKAVFVVVDEMHTVSGNGTNGEFMIPDLKNMITENTLSIRHMHRGSFNTPNFSNFIFLSDKKAPMPVEMQDRRMNAGDYQPNKLIISEEEVAALEKELPDIAAYYMTRPADPAKARRVLNTDTRTNLIQSSQTSLDAIATAVLQGDLDMLWDSLPDSRLVNKLSADAMSVYGAAFQELIHNIVLNNERTTKLTRDQLFVIFQHCIGKMPPSPSKFTKLLGHHNISLEVLRIGTDIVRGLRVHWKQDDEWYQTRRDIIKPPVELKAKTGSPLRRVK